MVLTRSQENLADITQPANVSFTVNLDSENPPVSSNGQESRSRVRRRSVHNGTTQNLNDGEVRQIISESLNSFRSEMTSLLTNEIRSVLENITVNHNSVNNNQNNNRATITENLPSSSNSNNDASQPYYAEKVLNIIRNWKLKFTGHDNEMTVDEFIYRVNILTTNNLKGDFELLCKHAHSLFEGKALAWFWRFHRQHDEIDWSTLTSELRKQYKVDYTDYDILDDIRRRRQKSHENFNEYLDVISAMADKLKNPITDHDLCEILIRNLKNEIRHELIHLEIHSVAHLRREVRKHEKFMKDVQAYESRKNNKSRVSELVNLNDNKPVDDLDEDEADSEICSLQNNRKCWNCDKIGHSYIDCMETKKVFCYGCGLKDMYKPTCPNCTKKKPGNVQRDVRRK